jgi:glycolate oxidase iron-sulfur subunit
MQTHLSPEFQGTPDGEQAEAILRKCVHCGFCNATCPTYQLLGDELDGPRGRIYLIKQLLEGGEVTRSTQQHLDRCLTCRNCESTCPSGVEYGHLADIGRRLVEQRVPRPAGERVVRWLLKEGLTSSMFAPALRVGRALSSVLPQSLKSKVQPPADAPIRGIPCREHGRKVLLPAGCVQPAMRPNIDGATRRVLDAAGIQAVTAGGADAAGGADGAAAAKSGCCGAIRQHLSDHDGALADMRRNVDAWWPLVESGAVEAIVVNASGCSVMVKDYGHALARDPAYAARAARISALTRDLCELLPDLAPALASRVHPERAGKIAVHSPCTLQHGQQIRGAVEIHLQALGFEVAGACAEAHLCCGSAGTYSVLQPELAGRLRDRKLENLGALGAGCIVSANIGCIQHLQSGCATPVRHWVEIVDDALADGLDNGPAGSPA